jgi:predicted nuclease of restriction endonuclease-like RecB superfamily
MEKSKYRNKKQKKALAPRKFKSGLERSFAKQAFEAGLHFDYETDRFKFITQSHYVPDFKIRENAFIETKGYFSPSNRSKMLSFREQYPHITIYMLFQNSKNRLSPKSKTTYAHWCEQHGFEYADIRNGIPKKWWGQDGSKTSS